MTTTVINIKDAPEGWQQDPNYVYIGRGGRGWDGRWGNPFVLRSIDPRGYTIGKYRKWLYDQPLSWRDELVGALDNKVLVCFCKPLGCHGDVIVDYIENLHFKV